MEWYLPAEGLVYDRGEAFAVYYSPLSGDTHLISELALGILRVIAARPLTTEGIADTLVAHIDQEDDAVELRTALPDILRLLANLDLVRAR